MSAHDLPSRFQPLETLDVPDAAGAWRARDTLLGREVLLKRPLAPEGGDAGADRERSLREARALARVQHASVARLLEVLDTPQGPLLVLEPLEGETLADRLAREHKLPPEEVRALGVELASALEAVHALGIVHRGVSASNVVLRPAPAAGGSRLVLAGFTFAKSAPGAGGGIPGTTFVYRRDGPRANEARAEPPHPAPEQIRGEPADARADVFGLGWVLYECLTGVSPYAIELEPKHWRAPRAPSDADRAVPRALSDCVLRCLAPAPAERPASAAAVRAALEDARPARRSPRRALLAAGALALAAALGLGLRAGWLGGADAPPDDRGTSERGSAVVARERTGLSARYATSRALLIGIGGAYAQTGFPELPNAERDVRALEARLHELDAAGREAWSVRTLLGPQATSEAIVRELRALAAAGEPNDKLFVYYAGHGEPARGEQSGFVIPAGAPTEKDDPSRLSWVRFDEFAHVLDETRAKHVLVAMDCCYGGRTAATDGVAMRSGVEAYQEKFLRERAHVVITSGRANEKVSDGATGQHSPFAQAFLDQLARSDEAVTSSELFSAVQRKLVNAGQTPLLRRPHPDAEGEVVFFLR